MEDSTNNSTSNNNLSLCEIKMKRSLVISPNLDALLEHEERTRAQASFMVSEMTTISAHSSRSVSPSEEFLVGLPPPPRHPPRAKMPHSTSCLKGNTLLSKDTELQAQEIHGELAHTSIFVQPTSSSTSNPYINPAPTLAELFADIPSKVSATTKPPISPFSQSRPCDHEQFLELSSHRSDSRDGSITSPWSPVDFSGGHSGQQSRPSTSLVPNLLRASLSPYIYHNVDPSIRDPEDRQQQNRITKALTPGPPQVHNKGKSEDMKDEDGQTQGVSSGAWSSAAIPWRRPLVSHASSANSTNTLSSHEPATTTENEPRISISSTVYPPSSGHSHSYSFYNDPVLSLTKSKQICDSHMEIYSLSNTECNLDGTPMDCPQLSPIQFSKLSLSEHPPPFISPDASSPCSSKPPLPTTPKPVFSRTSLKSGFSRQVFPILTERSKASGAPLSPTTNLLRAEERADLVRKTRKLARVFGQMPGADAMAHQEKSAQESAMSRCLPGLNDQDWPSGPRRKRSALQLEPSLLNGTRRHSVPLSPDDMPFMTNVSPDFEGYLSPSSDQACHAQFQIKSEPPSFINLSVDTLKGGDIAFVLPKLEKVTRSPSSSSQSHFEKMFEEEQADEDRRQKRERLVKLHRFLGSRVPVNLVLGIDNVEASLPPPHRSPTSASHGNTDHRKTWSMCRRSSSAILPSPRWPNDLEMVKEELNDKEKIINVRRAVKMEKVFGVAPPQTLYHTRHCPPPLLLASKSAPSKVATISSPTASASLPRPNPNRSAYLKFKPKKDNRPGSSDSNNSNMQLLPKGRQTFDDLANASGAKHSAIYNHYQYSLNSLHDILDRDDRESLVELHQFLNAGESPSPELEVSPVAIGHRMSDVSSIRSGRRRSLPARTSLDSEYSITSLEANVTTFQVRRRKAAKLTRFFGVDYRDVISDILQSIENGVEYEHENGTLRTEEVEDLLARLRNLKAKRQGFL